MELLTSLFDFKTIVSQSADVQIRFKARVHFWGPFSVLLALNVYILLTFFYCLWQIGPFGFVWRLEPSASQTRRSSNLVFAASVLLALSFVLVSNIFKGIPSPFTRASDHHWECQWLFRPVSPKTNIYVITYLFVYVINPSRLLNTRLLWCMRD